MTEPCQPQGSSQQFANGIAFAQGGYFLSTGIWPLVSYRSFEWISGPKVDSWLVKTVGVQVAVVGAVLARAAKNQRVTPEIELLAAGSALGLAAIDIAYASCGRIRRVYLLDAAAEIGFAAGWAIHRLNRGSRV